VTAVLDGSPAQQAGLKAGARILRFDGVPCEDAATFSRLLALRAPGDEVTLALDDAELKVTLGDRDAAQAALVSEASLGMSCVDVGPELRVFLELPEDVRGVVVRDVQPGSAAAAAGIQRGDVLWWGGDGAIADLDELRAAIAGAKETIVLRAYRDGQAVDFTVSLPRTRTSTR
jgi:serine protease Do